ncbi:MAG: hypothetical protein ABSE49_26700, partial [Polyangiaceae bacterium]
MHLDGLDVKPGGKAHPQLVDVRLGFVHFQRTNHDVDESDGEPSGAHTTDIHVEVAASSLGGDLTAHDGAEAQPERQCHHGRADEDVELPSTHREAHRVARRLTRERRPGHPHEAADRNAPL